MAVKQKEKTGILCMILASMLFATGGLFIKFVPWNPLAINGIRSFFGAIVIAAYMTVTHHKLKLTGTTAAGALAYLGMTTLFVASNQLAGAANAIVLQFTCPIWIILISWIFLHKQPSTLEWTAVAAVLFGICCFFLDSLTPGSLLGNTLALLSGICYALMFMQNTLADGDAISSVLLGQILGCILLGGFVLRETIFTPSVWLAVIWLGAFQVGAAYIFFSIGTRYIHPLQAALLTGLEPVLNPLLVAVFFHQWLSWLSLTGATVVVLSVVLYTLAAAGFLQLPVQCGSPRQE
ncbi:DMT family transporter [uncultured Faecalibaculum sp.]|uniref:DMT family transporter n=1 Tax=uncultured Faecalibaculum sp. TaxID=1729681 RepID=UPI00260D8233|nr:EamA family transporter [uncultured Faecalibaculum sp.]